MVTINSHYRTDKMISSVIFLLILTFYPVSGQEITYNYFYRVFFRDKGSTDVNNFTLSGLVSARAVERRQKAGILSPDYRDLPVNRAYLDQISLRGFRLHCVSRWMNTALFKTTDPADYGSLLNLPFVSDVKIVKDPGIKSLVYDKLFFSIYADAPQAYDRPLAMLGGDAVQLSGFTGRGVLVAVLDAGFQNGDNISSLEGLRGRNGIKGTYDFVKNSSFVYDYHNHGTAVLSVLSGVLPGQIAGTAPGADYLLFRTEDDATEYPVEEDFWIAGAEFADSLGADIITSSLGYFTFDDPGLDYKYSDMDGDRAFVTRAADIAASKGILVVCSAGNERTNDWLHIIAPSDGDSVLAVGAVNSVNYISEFSSAGPSYDRRIKPDIVAQGVSVPVQTQTSVTGRANGTSFSCPVISGMCACVMQAVPQATSYDILTEIHSVSDRYHNPDSLYGYGIPNFVELIARLQEKLVIKPLDESVVSPNPFTDKLTLTFRQLPGRLTIEIISASGRLISKKVYGYNISRSLQIDDLENIEQGIYFIRLSTPVGKNIHKVIKISR